MLALFLDLMLAFDVGFVFGFRVRPGFATCLDAPNNVWQALPKVCVGRIGFWQPCPPGSLCRNHCFWGLAAKRQSFLHKLLRVRESLGDP